MPSGGSRSCRQKNDQTEPSRTAFYNSCLLHHRWSFAQQPTPEVPLLTLDDAVSVAMPLHVCGRESEICADGDDFEAKFNAVTWEEWL